MPWCPGVSNVQVYAKLIKLIFENVHSFFIIFNTEYFSYVTIVK